MQIHPSVNEYFLGYKITGTRSMLHPLGRSSPLSYYSKKQLDALVGSYLE